jgi:hypothetical protein
MRISGLFFADDLSITSFRITGIKKGIHQVVKQCKDWNLTYIVNKTKIVVFKKGGKLKKNVR